LGKKKGRASSALLVKGSDGPRVPKKKEELVRKGSSCGTFFIQAGVEEGKGNLVQFSTGEKKRGRDFVDG